MDPGSDTELALLTLQTVHTLVYAAGQVSVLVLLWSGITGRPTPWLKFSLGCLSVIGKCGHEVRRHHVLICVVERGQHPAAPLGK